MQKLSDIFPKCINYKNKFSFSANRNIIFAVQNNLDLKAEDLIRQHIHFLRTKIFTQANGVQTNRSTT